MRSTSPSAGRAGSTSDLTNEELDVLCNEFAALDNLRSAVDYALAIFYAAQAASRHAKVHDTDYSELRRANNDYNDAARVLADANRDFRRTAHILAGLDD